MEDTYPFPRKERWGCRPKEWVYWIRMDTYVWETPQHLRPLKDGLENNLLELNTTVIYKTNPEKVTILYGVNNTLISLEDIKDKDFTVTTRARYNVTVAENASCTQVEKQVTGTMIQLYEFNPNKANIAGINFKLIVTLIMLMGLLNEHYSL